MWTLDRAARWIVKHPRTSIAIVIIYVISPVDLIPEAFVGPVGYIDDFLVMLLPFIARHYVRRHTEALRRPSKYTDTTAT
jgi:uncharacterized membrane protein YkvA (DUF1232 family)